MVPRVRFFVRAQSVCAFPWVHVRIYVRVYARVHVRVYVRVYVRVNVRVNVHVHVRVHQRPVVIWKVVVVEGPRCSVGGSPRRRLHMIAAAFSSLPLRSSRRAGFPHRCVLSEQVAPERVSTNSCKVAILSTHYCQSFPHPFPTSLLLPAPQSHPHQFPNPSSHRTPDIRIAAGGSIG